MKTHKRILIIFSFILIMLVSFVIAAPPFLNTQTSTLETELQIAYPKITYLKQYNNFTFNICVYNASGMIKDNTTTSCRICLTNSYGEVIIKDIMIWSGDNYYYNINGNNFSETGEYAYNINCNDSTNGGFASGEFLVNKTGKIFNFDNSLMMIIGLLGTLFILYWLAFTIKDIHPILSLIILLVTISLYPLLAGLFYNMSLGTTAEVIGLSFYTFCFRIVWVMMVYTIIYGIYKLFMFFGIDLWKSLFKKLGIKIKL